VDVGTIKSFAGCLDPGVVDLAAKGSGVPQLRRSLILKKGKRSDNQLFND
jgi:hypothetical protein